MSIYATKATQISHYSINFNVGSTSKPHIIKSQYTGTVRGLQSFCRQWLVNRHYPVSTAISYSEGK